jgi:RNase H-like domain found in reverse transcriptase
VDNTKLTAVVDWRQPPHLLNLSSFLGLTGYFRNLIKGYAKIAQPLTDLIRSVAIPKNAGKAAYRAALRRVKLENIWSTAHTDAFLDLKKCLMSDPVLKAPRFNGTPFIVMTDSCKKGFSAMLAQHFVETCPGSKVVNKIHPIAYTSKRTSLAKSRYKPFLLKFAALKFALDKFDDIVWGFPVEIETDCQALRDVVLSDDLNATHARWRDGVLSHQIVDIRHIPGCVNLAGDGFSRKDEDLPHIEGDGSSWSVPPDWEHARGLQYDLFTVETAVNTTHSTLQNRFKDESVFLEAIDALLGITGASSDADRKRAAHRAEGYFVEDNKLWRLGGATPSRAVPRRECVTKLEATQMAREEHAKLHMRRDHIRTQLLDRIYSPLLDASITTAIRECARCKNFGNMHIHSLLVPIT